MAKSKNPNGASSIYFGSDGYWHGRVTVGVKDDGTPDRRHVKRKKQADVVKRVRELERQRDDNRVEKIGERWTVAQWLQHWLENIATNSTSEYGHDAYEVAVRVHLVPGLGAHKLKKLEPEHLERLYAKGLREGHKPGNVHQWHRTLRTALGEAERRGYIGRNPATVAKAPKVTTEEVEPYTVEEVQRILKTAEDRRNGARWAIGLALGLRQGEALGMKWEDVDFASGILTVRRNRLRPKWAHGCKAESCGKQAGRCPKRKNTRRVTKDPKSEAGKRRIGLPAQILDVLREQKRRQDLDRVLAGERWHDEGWVFAKMTGEAVVPNTDYYNWLDLLEAAGVPRKRLHDARHTAATVLLVLGVPERTVMDIMGWSSAGMLKRYQHVSDALRRGVADQIGGLVWGPTETEKGPDD
jgi:integrase